MYFWYTFYRSTLRPPPRSWALSDLYQMNPMYYSPPGRILINWASFEHASKVRFTKSPFWGLELGNTVINTGKWWHTKNIYDERGKKKEVQVYAVVLSSFTENNVFLPTSFPFSTTALTIYSGHIALLGLLQRCFQDSYGAVFGYPRRMVKNDSLYNHGKDSVSE